MIIIHYKWYSIRNYSLIYYWQLLWDHGGYLVGLMVVVVALVVVMVVALVVVVVVAI